MSGDLFTEKKIKIWTIQMSNWRTAKKRNIPLKDITVHGKSIFSPYVSALLKYKSKAISEDDYTKLYIEKMRNLYTNNPAAWEELLNEQEFAVACFCSPNGFCHRYLFVDLIEKFAVSRGYVVEKCGEIMS